MGNLRKARIEKKLSQKELADELGVTTATISRYESGERKLPVETAKRIAELLDVNWYSLFDEGNQGI
jgi:transcriptional regulator with XRE-family HTH domain